MLSASPDPRGQIRGLQTATPYIRHDSIYFVPVWRYHLNFAVLVQRAFQQLQLTRQDLIAVELPESAARQVLAAVAKLPRVSLVISSLSDSDQREVIGITPCDGVIEGIRIALEHQIPLRFIDQEIAPGHLLNHVCLPDENWPDNGLVLQHGAEWYLNLTQARLTHPPSRFEPVDSWREMYMATQLRRLYPHFRRILFICGAAHVIPIRRLLGEPVFLTESDSPSLPKAKYDILEPSLSVLVRYLDYIPRLVEQYEKQRAEGNAGDFDKRIELLRLVYEFSQKAPDMSFSIRHYRTFTQMMTKLLEYEGRISPRFETVLLACRSSFNNPFAERIYRHLLGYYDQVRTERIGHVRGTDEAVFETNLANVQDPGRLFVARNCSQIEQSYEIYSIDGDQAGQDTENAPNIPPDQPPGWINLIEIERPPPAQRPKWRGEDPSSEEFTWSWPLMDVFENDMRSKAFTLAETRDDDRRVKSMEFQGAVLDGFDLRRTLRSYYVRRPKLYVKQRMPALAIPVDTNEPVVWIYDPSARFTPDSDWEFSYTWSGLWDGPRYIVDMFLQNSRKSLYEGKNKYGHEVKVWFHDVCGRVSFMPLDLTLDELTARLGDELDSRVPNEDDFEYLEDVENEKWWETLLLDALEYAQRSVILVAPREFVIPKRVARAELDLGKNIIHVPLSKFTREEIRKVTKLYWLTYQTEVETDDGNDPRYITEIMDKFGEIMHQFWE